MNEQPFDSKNETNTPYPAGIEENSKGFFYTLKEGIFALLSLVFAYCFVDLITVSNPGLGLSLLIFGFTAFVIVYQILINRFPTVRSIVCFVLLLATGVYFSLFNSPELSFFTLAFAMALGLYWLFITLGGSTSERFDYLAWFDAIKAFIILPFSCFGHTFAAIFRGLFGKHSENGQKKSRRPFYIFLGILAAIIPCAIVLTELSHDTAFKGLLDSIFRLPEFDLSDILVKLFFSIPIGCFLFGALFGSTRRSRKYLMTYEGTHRAAEKVRFLPLLLICTAITPLLLIYILYFFSQMPYFISGFMNIRPEEYTFAEYARNGFFELCRVSVVNLIVIAVAEIFSRKNGKKPVVLKIYNTVFSLFTLALMAIAQSKLILYIRAYGMTPLRVNTFWFTLVLGAVFLFILLYQFIPKLNFTRCAAVSFAVLFCALIFADTDAMIARYNIEQYKAGEVTELDTDLLLFGLSDSADYVILDELDSIPAGGARTKLNSHMRSRAESAKMSLKDEEHSADWREWNYASYRTKEKLIEVFGK